MMTSYKIHVNSNPEDVTAFLQHRPSGIGSSTASATPMDADGVWYLNRVVVPQEDRKQGIGTLLINILKSVLKMRGAKKLIVEPGGYATTLEEKLKFFRSCGFVVVGSIETEPLDWHMVFVF